MSFNQIKLSTHEHHYLDEETRLQTFIRVTEPSLKSYTKYRGWKMRGNFCTVTAFAVAFVLSRAFSAPVTQTYKMVRYHWNECNNTVNTRNLNAKFYARFSGLITFVTVNPAKLSQSRQKIIRTATVISCFDLTTMLGKALASTTPTPLAIHLILSYSLESSFYIQTLKTRDLDRILFHWQLGHQNVLYFSHINWKNLFPLGALVYTKNCNGSILIVFVAGKFNRKLAWKSYGEYQPPNYDTALNCHNLYNLIRMNLWYLF